VILRVLINARVILLGIHRLDNGFILEHAASTLGQRLLLHFLGGRGWRPFSGFRPTLGLHLIIIAHGPLPRRLRQPDIACELRLVHLDYHRHILLIYICQGPIAERPPDYPLRGIGLRFLLVELAELDLIGVRGGLDPQGLLVLVPQALVKVVDLIF